MNIQSERIKLVLREPEEVLAWIESMSPADRERVSPEWIARVRSTTGADPWAHGFRIIDKTTGNSIGSCAYKGPPDSEGMVEIAYGVDPEHQGRGYATEAAKALVDFALESDDVKIVRAHTLPVDGPSPQILRKCGFEYVGEVIDPEDGLVWRWERARLRSAD